MNNPDKPEQYIGRNVVTPEGQEGVVDSIGKLSDDPWVIFDDNAIPIRVGWHQIELADDGFVNNFYE